MEGGSGVSCRLSLGTQWHCGHRSPIQSSLLSLSEPFSTDYVNYAMRAYRDICYLLTNIPSLYVGVICAHVCNNNKISHFCNKSFTVKQTSEITSPPFSEVSQSSSCCHQRSCFLPWNWHECCSRATELLPCGFIAA